MENSVLFVLPGEIKSSTISFNLEFFVSFKLQRSSYPRYGNMNVCRISIGKFSRHGIPVKNKLVGIKSNFMVI